MTDRHGVTPGQSGQSGQARPTEQPLALALASGILAANWLTTSQLTPGHMHPVPTVLHLVQPVPALGRRVLAPLGLAEEYAEAAPPNGALAAPWTRLQTPDSRLWYLNKYMY